MRVKSLSLVLLYLGGLVQAEEWLDDGEACDPGSPAEFQRVSGLGVIVTGMENSGTTILSDLLKCGPGLMGAFECGLLLASKPGTFKHISPFYNWMTFPFPQWALRRDQLDDLSKSRCHAEFYAVRDSLWCLRCLVSSMLWFCSVARRSSWISSLSPRTPLGVFHDGRGRHQGQTSHEPRFSARATRWWTICGI